MGHEGRWDGDVDVDKEVRTGNMSKLTVVGKSSVVVGRWEDWREQRENQWRQLGLELIVMMGPDDEVLWC